MKDVKLLISSLLIIISFFVGLQYGKEQHEIQIRELNNKKEYVDIDVLKTKVKINSSSENIIITVNGNKTSSGVIELE